MAVIHRRHPVDRVGVASTLVQVRRRYTSLGELSVNAKAVKNPAQQLRMFSGIVRPQLAAIPITTAGIEAQVGVKVVRVRGRGMASALVGGVTFGFYGVDVNAGGVAVFIRACGAESTGRTHAENVHPVGQHS